jgi:kynurenine formamidase
MEFIDLSLPLEDDRGFAPWWARTRVHYQSHRVGLRAMRWLFGMPRALLPIDHGWSNETIHLSTHGTTHVDAPWHYAPTCADRPARTIDELPLDWFYGPGVVVDISDLDPRLAVDAEQLQDRLRGIPHTLQAGDVVLIQTNNDLDWGRPEYFGRGPGVSAQATRWLIQQGIRLMGIDAWGWDAPLREQARRARRERRRDIFWAAHYLGRELEYCHMERLANLHRLPRTGFTVCAFPLRVKRGSAGPARVVALVP